MDENFFAEHSANPQWTKTFLRSTLQIHNGRKLSAMDEKRPGWPRTASRHIEIPVQLSQIVPRGIDKIAASFVHGFFQDLLLNGLAFGNITKIELPIYRN